MPTSALFGVRWLATTVGACLCHLPRTYPLRAFLYLRVITFCNVLYLLTAYFVEYRTCTWLLLVWLTPTNSLCWLCSDLQSVTGYSERCKLNNDFAFRLYLLFVNIYLLSSPERCGAYALIRCLHRVFYRYLVVMYCCVWVIYFSESKLSECLSVNLGLPYFYG